MPAVLGLDIGGANLKAATSTGQAVTMPFPLWKQPDQLSGGISQLVQKLPTEGPVAITMTGELCDCFPNKAAGVRHILAVVENALRERPVFVWRNDGKWASIKHAQEDAQPVAAANWLASATYSGRYLTTGIGWFFDLGSTTLDMIPMLDGKPVAKGKTDLERLRAGELAYLGASRTPITSLVQYLEIEGEAVTVAAEFFATLDDVMILTKHVSENSKDRNTADGQPRTKEHAKQRLARMVCADADELGSKNLESMCKQIMDAYRKKLSSHLRFAHARHKGQLQHGWGGVVMAGLGEGFLAEELTRFANLGEKTSPVISMAGRVGAEVSSALAAYSVAVLLSERYAS
ncbi:MAG TPA: hydantoinase/oxoprolinase family protein [Gemmatales bacterium]|nr:hydantoinase/oxoprolinase family protein [Gemmatales bacterium]